MVDRIFSIPVDHVVKARDLLRSIGVSVISYESDPRGVGRVTIDQSKYGNALRALHAWHFKIGAISSISRSSDPSSGPAAGPDRQLVQLSDYRRVDRHWLRDQGESRSELAVVRTLVPRQDQDSLRDDGESRSELAVWASWGVYSRDEVEAPGREPICHHVAFDKLNARLGVWKGPGLRQNLGSTSMPITFSLRSASLRARTPVPHPTSSASLQLAGTERKTRSW